MSDLRMLYVVNYLVEHMDVYDLTFGSDVCLRKEDALNVIAELMYANDITEDELEENDCTPENVCVFRDDELRFEVYVKEVLLDANNLERIE